MEILRTVKEQAIDHLTVTEGNELDITCNITSSEQVLIVLESEAHSALWSRYIPQCTERLLRLTNSVGGRHRSDLVEIAKSSKMGAEDRWRETHSMSATA